ncbi:MAG TPA: ATP-dependent RNA helicase DbpA [Oceanospirillaceae bacterium]|nr:ATP-dependent RNA helicase DbpA [Oceanospirillaceae bacterium]
MSSYEFSSLKLSQELVSNIASLNFKAMTPIQAQALPYLLANKDVIAQAKTGSGKTATFGLGILNKLAVKQFQVQSLVLCPTRELADQVAGEIRRLARGMHNIKVLNICGGMPFGPQINSLQHGAHIVVGTPGRIEDHIRKGHLQLQQVTTLVLDEADRMLDMGFKEVLYTIIGHLPSKRQTLLFSATYPSQIEAMATRYLQQPVTIKVAEVHNQHSIQQQVYKVTDEESRFDAVRLLLLKQQPQSCLIFCNTKRETQTLADQLNAHGFSAAALHGDLEQKQRDQTLARFANYSMSILVATDVAARGLDITALDLVINYQIARELEVHTHRVGRTGRAGASGLACSLYSQQEAYKLELLENYLGYALPQAKLPPASLLRSTPPKPAMVTLQISGGKKQKLRPGDIVGALTGEDGIPGEQIGKIQVGDHWAYVAVAHKFRKQALNKLSAGKLKGRRFKARWLH